MSNKINRLVLELELHTQERAKRLQTRFDVFCAERLIVLLGEILSPFSISTRSHLLTSLEVDLGEVPEQGMESILEERLRRELRTQLIKLLGLPLSLTTKYHALDSTDLLAELEVQTVDTVEHQLSALVFFLEHGVLPWFAAGAGTVDFLLKELSTQAPHILIPWLKKRLVYLDVRARIAARLTYSKHHRLLKLLTPEGASTIESWLNPLLTWLSRCLTRSFSVSTSPSRTQLTQRLWETTLLYLCSNSFHFDAKQWVSQVLKDLAKEIGQNQLNDESLLIELISEAKYQSSITTPAIRELHTALLFLYEQFLLGRVRARVSNEHTWSTNPSVQSAQRNLTDKEIEWALNQLKPFHAAAQHLIDPAALRLQVLRLIVKPYEPSQLKRTFALLRALVRAARQLGLSIVEQNAAQATLLRVGLGLRSHFPSKEAIQITLQMLVMQHAIPLSKWIAALQVETKKQGSLNSLVDHLSNVFEPTLQASEEKSVTPAEQIAKSLQAEQSAQKVVQAQTNAWQAMLYFLDKGELPAYQEQHMLHSAQWFAQALQTITHDSPKQEVINALRSRANRPDVLNRLCRYMPPSVLQQLIQWLIPTHADAVITLLKATQQLEHDATLTAQQRERSKLLHWQLTFAFLLDPHACAFSLQAFCERLATQIAQRLGLPSRSYISNLLKSDMAPLTRATHDLTELNATSNSPLFVLDNFLRFGQLSDDGIDTLERALCKSDSLRGASLIAIRKRLQQAAAQPLERARLASSLNGELILKGLRWIWPKQQPSLQILIESLMRVGKTMDGRADFWRGVIIEALLEALSRRVLRDWRDILTIAIKPLLQAQPKIADKVFAVLREDFASTDQSHVLLAALDCVELVLTVPIQSALSKPEKHETQKFNQEIKQQKQVERAQASAIKLPEHTKHRINKIKKQELPAQEPFYINNAGMVLLWPFLSRYFQILELVNEKEFRSPEAQMRAVYLLQYLASASCDTEEPELLLNKILCGATELVAIDSTLADIQLSEKEIAISEELLYGVTQNWKKLNNTSIHGLQTSFLLRSGKLEKRKDNAWTLSVSLRAYDVLLDTLPWGLSTIRLPWMQDVLYVRWR